MLDMEAELKGVAENLNVLLVGNNPIELNRVNESMKNASGRKILTEIAFDIKSLFERLVNFSPNYILIDDNIGKSEVRNAVRLLVSDKKTKHVPIAILKNSNYEEVFSVGVMDYILKENITGQSLYTALANSLKFRRTQAYLYSALKKRKKQLRKLAKRAYQI